MTSDALEARGGQDEGHVKGRNVGPDCDFAHDIHHGCIACDWGGVGGGVCTSEMHIHALQHCVCSFIVV